jgi:transcriptional regulator with XRE-family HTH domain
METFGQRLKRLREEAGKSRLELAEYVGITRTSIALLENGQSGSMKGKNLLRAAEFLGVIRRSSNSVRAATRCARRPTPTRRPPGARCAGRPPCATCR